MTPLAATAASVDDLVKEAELWLYNRKHLLPGDRVIRDAAREAFAVNEAAALAAVRSEIPARILKRAVDAMFSKRLGRKGGTILEWLKGPPGKHGKKSLSEVAQKRAYLKSLRVDTWLLTGISNARLRAYSQSVVDRKSTRLNSSHIQKSRMPSSA